MRDEDYLISTYRSHGHALARGTDPKRVMAELFGKQDGVSGGRGGSMHMFDGERRFMGGYGIVGANLPLAAGIALSCDYRGTDDVTVCVFGDGAANQGTFGETLNLAALWNLPVVFMVTNNQFGMGTALERHTAQTDLHKRGEGFGVPGLRCDGMDVVDTYEVLSEAIETRALRPHADPRRGRDLPLRRALDGRPGGVPRQGAGRGVAQARPDPRPTRAGSTSATRTSSQARRGGGGADRRGRRVRRGSDFPPPESIYDHVYVRLMAELRYREALNEALREELQRDERVLIIGEDIGVFNGAFKVTQGLLDEFGDKRVRDTPISENTIVGVGVGAAMTGLRPVVELMTVNFSLLAMDQIVNHMATIHYMFGGQATVPMVVRMPQGAGHQLGPTHSHCLEAIYLHVPGMLLAVPSTPADAKGLLKAAIRDDNPVVFIEHESLYGAKGEVPDDEDHIVDFGQAAIRREGDDVTIVGISRMAITAQEAAKVLEEEHEVSAEVIDPRTLRPLDLDTILESVRKTNRAVIVEEGWPHGGVGANLAALIQEQAFDHLDAPIARVTGADLPMPYSKPLEQIAFPHEPQIVETVLSLFGDR